MSEAIKSSQEEKIQKIEGEILNFHQQIQNLQEKLPQETQEEKREILQKQIQELEDKVKKLEKEKQEIIQKTQGEIQDTKISTSQSQELQNEVQNNSSLSAGEKRDISQILEDGLKIEGIQGSILGLLLKLINGFLAMFGKTQENNEYIPEDEIDPSTGEKKHGIKSFEIKEISKKEYISQATEYAKEVEEKYGIPAEICIAQSVLESNWGKSGLSQRSNNYFGIKATQGQRGQRYATKEFSSGKYITIKDSFCVYDSMRDSFLDYGRFLTQNPRYKEAFAYSSNAQFYQGKKSYQKRDSLKFIEEIKKAGYATDPNYVSKVASIAKSVQNV